MRRASSLLAVSLAVSCLALAPLAFGQATFGGGGAAGVKLQGSSPGTPQAGSANITGTLIAGQGSISAQGGGAVFDNSTSGAASVYLGKTNAGAVEIGRAGTTATSHSDILVAGSEANIYARDGWQSAGGGGRFIASTSNNEGVAFMAADPLNGGGFVVVGRANAGTEPAAFRWLNAGAYNTTALQWSLGLRPGDSSLRLTSDANASAEAFNVSQGAAPVVNFARSATFGGPLAQSSGGTGAAALTCTAGQFLTSNGTAYSCATPAVATFVGGPYTLSPANISVANTSAEYTATLSGVVAGDSCTVGHLAFPTGSANNGDVSAYVVSAGIVVFRFSAYNGGWTGIPAGGYYARCFH